MAVLVAGFTGYWGYGQFKAKEQLEIYVGNKYQQSFYDMVEHIEQLQVLLGKSLVSTSPKQTILTLTDVWSHANTAQSELNKLPLAAQTVYDTAKFLSQTGDYSHVLARNQAEGKVMTDENRQQLSRMRQQAIKIVESLQRVESQVFAGDVNWVNLIKQAGDVMRGDQTQEDSPLGDGLADIRDEVSKFPTLIYDGPFSDHISDRKPRGLSGEEIDQEKAKSRVRKVLSFKNNQDFTISDGTTVNGRIPSYNFQVKSKEQLFSIDISKKGGHLVSMLTNWDVNSSNISQQDAVNRARDFLAAVGYPNMEATYSEIRDNISFISFAYQPKDIRYYPDIINVQVAMNSGQILAVEALSYLMSHQERELEKPKISAEEARELAGNTLDSIDHTQLVVIPQASLKEALAYEVRGTVGGETYLIYINAISGQEEQILKVIMGEQGTFAL